MATDVDAHEAEYQIPMKSVSATGNNPFDPESSRTSTSSTSQSDPCQPEIRRREGPLRLAQ